MLPLKVFPALNLTAYFAGTWIDSPVAGFLASLAAFLTVEKEPKPMKLILSFCFRSSDRVSNADWITISVSFVERALLLATREINSLLFIFRSYMSSNKYLKVLTIYYSTR